MVVGQDVPFGDEGDEDEKLGIVTKLMTSKVATIDDTIAALQSLKTAGAPGSAVIGCTVEAQEVYNKAKQSVARNGHITDEQKRIIKATELRYWVEFYQ